MSGERCRAALSPLPAKEIPDRWAWCYEVKVVYWMLVVTSWGNDDGVYGDLMRWEGDVLSGEWGVDSGV